MPNSWKDKFWKIEYFKNLIAQNSIYESIYIYTNNIDDKYQWLKNKFKKDVHIFINEINFDNIDKNKINLCVFDDLVFFSDKKISSFFTQSRKLNVTCVLICHRYFCIDRLLRNNIDYIIYTKLDKREINMIYNNITLNINLKNFQKINDDLKKYDFIIIDKKQNMIFF